jgi:CDP-paratose 2-epimerase
VRVLITGGAGFIGSELGCLFRQEFPSAEIVAMDNLRRRGSELNVQRLRDRGITFVHGDVRQRSDIDDLPGNFDVMIEASAEPSVHAGLDGSPDYALATNLIGTMHCLAFARARVGRLIFLSTSRVYSIASLRSIALETCPSRFEIAADQTMPGVSARGIREEFPTHLPRSIYGATKLASEMLVQEYADSYGLRAVSNRCGVIAGPGQFGNTGQGVFTLWVARHRFGLPLAYTGFGGTGKQVRDLLHPADLFALMLRQLERMDACPGESFNVGGGREISTSLSEFTSICREVTGRETEVRAGSDETAAVDVPLYLSDTTRARERFGWMPTRSVRSIVEEIHEWLERNDATLRPLFGAA